MKCLVYLSLHLKTKHEMSIAKISRLAKLNLMQVLKK
jgi:hypothetical protein